MLDKNKTLLEAVKFANMVGSMTVRKKGAIPSLPTIEELKKEFNI